MDARLRAIADPTRRNILARLQGGSEAAAGDLARGFDMSRPAVSRHLKVLLDAELIVVRKQAQSRLYTANGARIHELRNWFDGYWDTVLPNLKSVVERAHKGKLG